MNSNPIVNQILKASTLDKGRGMILVNAIFDINCIMPDYVKAKRPSFLNFQQVMKWNGSAINASIAAMSAMNSDHGCFERGFDFISSCRKTKDPVQLKKRISMLLDSGAKIPGFGNPVIKGKPDERFESLLQLIKVAVGDDEFNHVNNIINAAQSAIFDKKGITLYPNLVFWNAMITCILGLPRKYSSMIFLMAVIPTYLNQEA